jgi:Flagellar biosynthesis/type III secretory pathway protein
MRSSNKVIKAAAIKVIRQQLLETSPEAESSNQGAGNPGSPELYRHQPSAVDQLPGEKEEKIKFVRQEAYDLGMAEGMKRGAAQQKQELAKLVNTLSGLIDELSREKKEFLNRMESEVLNLAFAIAEKVLNHEIATDKDAICKVLGGALKKIVDPEGMRIRVNPDDYRYLTERKADIFPGLEGIKGVMLEEDATIARGGAVIDSAFGEVDARLDQQIGDLKVALSGH